MPQKPEYQLKKRKRWLGNLTLPDGSAGKCIIESREEKYALLKYHYLEKRHPDCVFEKEPVLQLIADPRKILREQIKPYREIYDEYYDFQAAILQKPMFYPKNKHFNHSLMWLRGFPPYKFIYKEDNSIYAIEIAAISDRNALEKYYYFQERYPNYDYPLTFEKEWGCGADYTLELEHYLLCEASDNVRIEFLEFQVNLEGAILTPFGCRDYFLRK